MAKSRLTDDPSPSSTKPTGLLPGIRPFMNQTGGASKSRTVTAVYPRPRLVAFTISMTPKPNTMEIILVGTHPIRPKDMEAHRKLTSSQEESFKRFEQSLEEGDTLIPAVWTRFLNKSQATDMLAGKPRSI
ncbi:hypothetical protein OS493_028188 [Desmophyllum pertusum]|uniref:Uncharacterized protein n=1 Tax=Desmophyllum pertusum TaxID=174260 RepID=A0A9W9YX16_9CNID|nr:hypothetical protein OS493_028188 [Desmophyllum pertusum]